MRTPRPVVLVLALLLWAGPLQAAGIAERDLWYLLSAQGEAIGSVHVVSQPADDGLVRLVWTTRVPINFLGQQQETRVTTELVMTEDWRPVSMTSVTAEMSGSTVVEGELLEGQLTITSTTDAGTTTSSTPVEGGRPLIFESCLGEWLAAQDAGPEPLQVEAVDDGTWQLVQLTARPLPPDGHDRRWKISRATGERLTLRLGADGFEAGRDYPDLGLALTRCTEQEAAAVQPIQQTGRTVLSFAVDRPLPALDQLTGLTVELRWRDILLEDFELEDDRQRLVEHGEDDQGHRAVVVLGAPPPAPADQPFPIRQDGLEPFLAVTEFIKPFDTAIGATAREIATGQDHALGAVRALSTWVHEAVDGALIAETLSGPEVLARRTGKCSEYAILFASLARSLGLPTRVALGERLVGDSWGGHMWNEVFVGRWIPVDATVDEVGASMALLKFVHSDTVAGTQPLRWALTSSLDIRVLDYAVAEGVEPLLTGLDGGTFTHVEDGYRIRAPRDDWPVHDLSEAGTVTLRFEVPRAPGVQIHFAAFELPPGVEAATLARSRVEALFRPLYDSLEVSAEEALRVAGGEGLRSELVGRHADRDGATRTTEIVWVDGSDGFLLNLVAPEQQHAAHTDAFEALLASFERL